MTESRSSSPVRRGRWVRWVLYVVLALVAVWLLFEFVFPWVESRWYNPAVGTVTLMT